MKRILIVFILGLILMLSLGTSLVFAGPPEAIYIDPNAENAGNNVTIIKEGNNDGPPQVWIKRDGTWTFVNPNAGP